MATWQFTCRDNGGKRQSFEVKAGDKTEAINKGFKRANRYSKGDVITWDCRLKRA
jgi:hypothetical protein